MTGSKITEVTVSCANTVDDSREEYLIWNEEGLNEFLDADGLETVTTLLEGIQREQDDTDSANQMKAFDIVRMVGSDSMHFINDPEIEEALDFWRSSGMDDLHDKSYFKEMVQGGESVWMTDARNQVQQFTPEMLEQRVDLNGLFDTDGGYDYLDKELELEIVGIGESHGVAKSKYGGVFVAKGVLKYLGPERGYIGYKFKCWCMFTNAKYPWRTSVNGVIVD